MPTSLKKWWETMMPDVGTWKTIAKLEPHSLVKITAMSSENNHYHAWEIYFMRAYHNYEPVMKQIKIPIIHPHSADVEWRILKEDGTIQARKKTYNTARLITVFDPVILKGSIKKVSP